MATQTLLRNDRKHPLSKNGSHRHGQFEWHDENCMIEDYGIQMGVYSGPQRVIWCATHGQWAHESPVKTIYVFEDGTKIEK